MDPDCEDNSHLPTFGILLHGDDRPLTLTPQDYVLQNDDHVNEDGNKGKVRGPRRCRGPAVCPHSHPALRSFVSPASCLWTCLRRAARSGSWATSSCGACRPSPDHWWRRCVNLTPVLPPRDCSKYYTIFDRKNNRIGFARAKHDPAAAEQAMHSAEDMVRERARLGRAPARSPLACVP